MMNETSVRDFNGNIQAALNAGTPIVRIPAGQYRTATLRIRSNTRLIADPDACITFADGAGRDSRCFLLTNHDLDAGNTNIHIEGGVWDGNNAANPRGPDRPGSFTGAAFNFRNVRGLTIRAVTIHNATAYSLRLTDVRDFVLERIRFTADRLLPNQDGIHVAGGCEDGRISDIAATGTGVTHDDLVALVADDALHRAQNLDSKCGPIRRIQIENLRAEDCHSFLRLASVHHAIEDVEVRDVRGGCRVCAVNADALRYCRVPVFDPGDPRYAAGVGLLKNITLTGWDIFKSASNDMPLFLLETRMQHFVIRDVRRDLTRDVAPDAKLVRVRGIETDTLSLQLTEDNVPSPVTEPLAPATRSAGGSSITIKRDGQWLLQERAFRELSVASSLILNVPV